MSMIPALIPMNKYILSHPYNTNFGAVITYHCKESETLFMAVCGSDGEWETDPALLKSEKEIPGRLLRRNHIILFVCHSPYAHMYMSYVLYN